MILTLLNTPKDHPSRRETDTYYLDDTHVLRTQMTVMWPYYLKDQEVLEKIRKRRRGKGFVRQELFLEKMKLIENIFRPSIRLTAYMICKKDKKIITLRGFKRSCKLKWQKVFSAKI